MSKITKQKKKQIPSALRISVWDANGGKDQRKMECYVKCGNIIDVTNFECGHVEAESKGGKTTLKNLKPICKKCNLSMGSKNMEQFREDCGFLNETDKVMDEALLAAEILSKDAKETNTAFDDGFVAEYNYQHLTFMGVLHLLNYRRLAINENEMLKDTIILRNILHKYQICHEKDYGTTFNDLKIINKCKIAEDLDKVTSSQCEIITKSGSRCLNKAKIDKKCKIHSKK